jgi:ABC-type sugar transport system permease subunit
MNLSINARERIFSVSLLMPCFLFVVLFAFYPILYSFYLSLHKIILGLPSLGQPFTGLANYRELQPSLKFFLDL